jgi:hypothetical protein
VNEQEGSEPVAGDEEANEEAAEVSEHANDVVGTRPLSLLRSTSLSSQGLLCSFKSS